MRCCQAENLADIRHLLLRPSSCASSTSGKLVESLCIHEQCWRNGRLAFLREDYDTLQYKDACDP
jgi:hypothetical protein